MIEREKLVAIVTAAQKGEGNAVAVLYDTFQEDLYYYILKTVNNKDLAADLTQDAFVEIIQTIESLKEPAAFVTWSKTIAYHKCTAYFRKRKDLLADENEDGETVFDTIIEEREEFIPDEALDKEELKKAIQEMIDELPEEQRTAIMMRYFDEISVKEIAGIQGVSEGTVKSRLNYGRKAIKESVETYEKKNGVKLHCVGVVPMLLWLFRQYKVAEASEYIAEKSVETIAMRIDRNNEINADNYVESNTANHQINSIDKEHSGMKMQENVSSAITEVAKVGADVGMKRVALKILAAILAGTLIIGGIIIGTGKEAGTQLAGDSNHEMEHEGEELPVDVEEKIDYDFLENLLCHLPLYDEEQPITKNAFYDLMLYNTLHLYLCDNGANNPEDFPTVLNSEDIIEIVVPDDGMITDYWQMYIRIKGDSFDEIASIVNFTDFDAEAFLAEFANEYSLMDWDEGSIRLSTEGVCGSMEVTSVEIIDAYYEEGMYLVEYTFSKNSEMGFSIPASTRIAKLEFTESGYVITSIENKEENKEELKEESEKENVNLNEYIYLEENEFTGYSVMFDIQSFQDSYGDNVEYEVSEDGVISFGNGGITYVCGTEYGAIDDGVVEWVIDEGTYSFMCSGLRIRFEGEDKEYTVDNLYPREIAEGDVLELSWDEEQIALLEAMYGLNISCEVYVYEVGK